MLLEPQWLRERHYNHGDHSVLTRLAPFWALMVLQMLGSYCQFQTLDVKILLHSWVCVLVQFLFCFVFFYLWETVIKFRAKAFVVISKGRGWDDYLRRKHSKKNLNSQSCCINIVDTNNPRIKKKLSLFVVYFYLLIIFQSYCNHASFSITHSVSHSFGTTIFPEL